MRYLMAIIFTTFLMTGFANAKLSDPDFDAGNDKSAMAKITSGLLKKCPDANISVEAVSFCFKTNMGIITSHDGFSRETCEDMQQNYSGIYIPTDYKCDQLSSSKKEKSSLVQLSSIETPAGAPWTSYSANEMASDSPLSDK